MEIVFDDREKRGLEEAIAASGLEVKWERLNDAADVVIKYNGTPIFGFERKSGSDLTSSIKTNHLFHQRDQMLDWSRRTGARVVLLIESPYQVNTLGAFCPQTPYVSGIFPRTDR